MSGEDDESKITSVRYYILKDDNAEEFYDEWKFKTLAIIRKKGWNAPFESGREIPESEEEATTEELKRNYTANAEAYDQILMGCSGVALGLVRRAKGSARTAIKL